MEFPFSLSYKLIITINTVKNLGHIKLTPSDKLDKIFHSLLYGKDRISTNKYFLEL